MRFAHAIIMFTGILLVLGCGATPSMAPVPEVELVTTADGEAAIEKGDFQGAADIFTTLVTQTPGDAVAHYYLGFCQDNLGAQNDAVAEYQKAIQLDPNLTNARMNLGLVFLEMEKIDEAIAEFTTVATAEPDAADVQYNLAMAYEAAGKSDDARIYYEKSASLDPEDPDPIIALGDMEKNAGKLGKAIEYYEKAQSIGMGSAVAVMNHAQILIEQKKANKAATKLLSLADMEIDAATLTSAGLMLAKLKKTKDAITIYKQVVTAAPDYAPVHILLGNALARSGNFQDGATHFEKFLELAPEAPEAASAQKGLAACKAKLTE